MAKTQIKYSSSRNALRRVKGSAKTCLGVLCATLLVVAALPSASNAVAAGGSGDAGASARTSPAAVGAPSGTPVFEVSDRAQADRPPVEEAPGAPAPDREGLPSEEQPPSRPEAGMPGGPSPDAGGQEDAEAPSPERASGEAVEADAPETELTAPEEPAFNALAAAPRAADPPGFSWKFADIDADTCKINGYDGGTITSGTVHVPATNPNNGKKVVSISSSAYPAADSTFQNLQCAIDFSQAVNLQRIEKFAFSKAGLKGTIDLSACTNLKTIDTYAFKESLSLTGVVLPPNLVTLGGYAFMGNPGITGSLALPKSLNALGPYAFQECKLTSLAIPTGTALNSIGQYAFSRNRIAGSLTFPESIKSVQASAFANNQISAVTFQAGTVAVYDRAFQNNLIANNPFEGKTFSTLGQYAFAGNRLSGEVSFANDATANPSKGVIADNPLVTKVVISSQWLLVPNDMFKGLTQLTDVVFPSPNKIQRIGASAFQGCSSLASINFGNAPLADQTASGADRIAIGASAFQGCSSLGEVRVGNGVFPGQLFVTITIGASAFEDCGALYDIDIPEPLSGVTRFNVNIGDRAFKNTNLGAFPVPGSVTQTNPHGTPLGYLPLDRRNVLSIGASAFENAGLDGVKLPNSLRSVGARAFAGNHMTNLVLPNNAALDDPGSVGANVLANQTVDAPAFWGDYDQDPGKADIVLEALHAFGLVHERVDAVGLNVVGVGNNIQPENPDWKGERKARYAKSQVTAQGTTFTYGYELWRAGGSGPLSHGDVTLSSIEKGVPFKFHYYDDEGFSGQSQEHVQWVGTGFSPMEQSHDVANFGLDKPGYHTQAGAYDAQANAGWRTGPGPGGTGTSVDPETVVAVDGQKPEFYNRWIANSYSVAFDNGFERMAEQDPRLVETDAQGALKWVSGSMGAVPGFVYGEGKALPGNAFKMGAYEFAGWATSPDLAEADRVPGRSFFEPGALIAFPDPAPGNGGTLTLYAQWKPQKTYDAANGFLVPSKIEMRSKDGYPQADVEVRMVGADRPADDQEPGALWPEGSTYDFSIPWTSTGARGMWSLSGPGGTKPFAILKPDGTPYEPGSPASPGDPPPNKLVRFSYNTAGAPERTSATITLKADEPWTSFKEGVYTTTLTYYFEKVAP